MKHHAYPLRDVIALGFEARCVGPDGVHYLWHRGFGLRSDPRKQVTTLITDPAKLPDAPWFATELGEEELEMRDSGEQIVGSDS